jgi:hypothetical protein
MGPCRGRHKATPSITFSVVAEPCQTVEHWFKAGNLIAVSEMPPGVVVYAGKGSSHSWTWLADLLETHQLLDVRFLDERDFVRSLREEASTAIISGGDAFAIASSLSGEGSSELKRFIASGGSYIGICAGAYLPLPTSTPPLDEFNICSVKIDNIVTRRPASDDGSPRICAPYCDRLILHPVRGEVLLSFDGRPLEAPLYGGPIFREPSEGRVLGRFSEFTGSTEIQVSRADAEELVLGKPAVIEAGCGEGRVLLLSPHLEHPGYPEANRMFLDLLEQKAKRSGDRTLPESIVRRRNSELSRSAADLSVALMGLEGRSFLVGGKLWDTERLMVLAEAVRKRAASLPPGHSECLSVRVRALRESVLSRHPGDSEPLDHVLDPLMSVARDCVNLRFEQMRTGR